MVCRVRCNADAASEDDSPFVICGMSCCRNGDWRGSDAIMSIVFCAIVVMSLLVVSGGVLVLMYTRDTEEGVLS